MSRPRRPFCADCGGGNAHVAEHPSGGHIWLCASCEALRNDPSLALRTQPEGLPATWPKRRGKPQKETLF